MAKQIKTPTLHTHGPWFPLKSLHLWSVGQNPGQKLPGQIPLFSVGRKTRTKIHLYKISLITFNNSINQCTMHPCMYVCMRVHVCMCIYIAYSMSCCILRWKVLLKNKRNGPSLHNSQIALLPLYIEMKGAIEKINEKALRCIIAK